MDPSALIFIALAVAWAVYLIPKALEHHEESVRTRTVERFSATMRVLARREPVSRRQARLVPTRSSAPSDTSGTSRPPTGRPDVSLDAGASTPAAAARRRTAARAARRRLRVVSVILLANLVVVALAAAHVVAWAWIAAPVVVLVAWLVACRLMVKRERSATPRRSVRPTTGPTGAPGGTRAGSGVPVDDADATGSIPAVAVGDSAGSSTTYAEGSAPVATDDPQSWDPVPVTLPTYVTKPVAPRSVRTIDLDSTGVWSSGRNDEDSELVREADAREAQARKDSSARQRRRA